MPAVRNAVRHALGFGINELPLTAARVLEAISSRRGADAR